MSDFQKTFMKSKLPPRCPTNKTAKLAPGFGAGRRKDYTPVSWKQYFDRYLDVVTDAGCFRVYLSAEPDDPRRPRIVTLHGGGYSGLTWSLFTKEITSMINCQVVSIDLRGHGDTDCADMDNLSADSLTNDVKQVIEKVFGPEPPPIVLVGHSMGGAIAVRVSLLPELEHCIEGLVVIDVVEGTAMDALASMQSFLRGRPTHFKSIEHAIEWCVRSGQVRNVESAKVSMPGQILNCETGFLATNELDNYHPDELVSPTEAPTKMAARPTLATAIEEEEEDAEMTENTAKKAESPDESTFKTPGDLASAGALPDHRYRWRIDLSRTEQHWAGWFQDLSASFLTVRAPRLLLLASIDGLDRELTVGQMQGKFQMQVLTRCGHAVHEDCPDEVAHVIAAFVLRHRLTSPVEDGVMASFTSMPGC